MKITCSMCHIKKEIKCEGFLPYRWSEVHRKTGDVHDSGVIYWESDLYICPKCLVLLLGKGH